MAQRTFDLTRCKEASEYYAQDNHTFSDVAKEFGVGIERARIMILTWQQHALLEETRQDLKDYRNSLYAPQYAVK